jgi:hypothetical protein
MKMEDGQDAPDEGNFYYEENQVRVFGIYLENPYKHHFCLVQVGAARSQRGRLEAG